MKGDTHTNEDILFPEKAAALVDKLAHMLPLAEDQTLGRTLGDAERQTTNLNAG